MNRQSPPPSAPDDDAWLTAMIRPAPQDYLPDNGFTSRVLGALPPPNWRTERRRLVLLLGSASLGCVIAGVLAGPSFSADCLGLTERITAALAAPTPGVGTALAAGSVTALAAALALGWWTLARSR
jgi:hypothetical protein